MPCHQTHVQCAVIVEVVVGRQTIRARAGAAATSSPQHVVMWTRRRLLVLAAALPATAELPRGPHSISVGAETLHGCTCLPRSVDTGEVVHDGCGWPEQGWCDVEPGCEGARNVSTAGDYDGWDECACTSDHTSGGSACGSVGGLWGPMERLRARLRGAGGAGGGGGRRQPSKFSSEHQSLGWPQAVLSLVQGLAAGVVASPATPPPSVHLPAAQPPPPPQRRGSEQAEVASAEMQAHQQRFERWRGRSCVSLLPPSPPLWPHRHFNLW
jgi:hypothetical protein